MAVGYSCTRTLGRKRVCSDGITPNNSEWSSLEALPQDILIKVLCGVDHEDLKQLFHVSKRIREATLVAKEFHFGYSTPKKKTLGFFSPIDMEDGKWFEEIEVPNAPLRKCKSRLNGSKLSYLFASMMDDEQQSTFDDRIIEEHCK